MNALLRLVPLGVSACLGACSTDPCATRGDILAGPGGLQVTQEEHVVGWGLEDCYQCHSVATLHLDGCSSSSLTAEDILDRVDPDDPTSCQDCHGTNGTEEVAP